MIERTLSALAAAWIVTVVATTLLAAALGLAPFWDERVFLLALRDALTVDPL